MNPVRAARCTIRSVTEPHHEGESETEDSDTADAIDDSPTPFERAQDCADELVGRPATIRVSGETGTVIGFAFYATSEPDFRGRYEDRTGRAVERWWSHEGVDLGS
jgi:hypothetical protein